MKSTPHPDENNETVIIDTTPEMRHAFKWGDLDGAIFGKKWNILMKKSCSGRKTCFYFQEEVLARTISTT